MPQLCFSNLHGKACSRSDTMIRFCLRPFLFQIASSVRSKVVSCVCETFVVQKWSWGDDIYKNSTVSGEVDLSKSKPLSRLRGGETSVLINFAVAPGSNDLTVGLTSSNLIFFLFYFIQIRVLYLSICIMQVNTHLVATLNMLYDECH